VRPRVDLTPWALAQYGVFVAGVVFFAIAPLFMGNFRQTQLVAVGIYFIAIIGLNIVSGYSGQISLGHGAFMGIGAYTTAILVSKYDWGQEWTIPIAGLAAGVIGFLFGFPALRLSGAYLALATFALAIAFIQLAQSSRFEEWTGGGGGIALGVPQTPYYLTWSIALVLFVTAWLFLNGRLGRRLRAVRDAPVAAVSSGINLALAKALAFGLAAAYGGVAGALLAIQTGFVNYLTFPVVLSILLLTGAAIGGFGSLGGMIFGALFIQYAPEWSADLPHVPATSAPAVAYGVVLLVVLFLMPGGVVQLVKRLVSLLKRLTGARYSRPTGGRVVT
jgi:branched-chain amino acid transport system permease protein